MSKFYVVYGVSILLFFTFANFRGWTVMDSIAAGSWSPHGAAGQNYHK